MRGIAKLNNLLEHNTLTESKADPMMHIPYLQEHKLTGSAKKSTKWFQCQESAIFRENGPMAE